MGKDSRLAVDGIALGRVVQQQECEVQRGCVRFVGFVRFVFHVRLVGSFVSFVGSPPAPTVLAATISSTTTTCAFAIAATTKAAPAPTAALPPTAALATTAAPSCCNYFAAYPAYFTIYFTGSIKVRGVPCDVVTYKLVIQSGVGWGGG
jgi:hypothetical protein